MQCVIHGSCTVCAHPDQGQGISCSRKKLSITLKISELVLRPGSCLQNRNSSCISFWKGCWHPLNVGHLNRHQCCMTWSFCSGKLQNDLSFLHFMAMAGNRFCHPTAQ